MQSHVNINMSEDWMNDRLGVDFSEDFWLDPVRRTENRRELSRELYRKYGEVGLGEAEPLPVPIASDEYGHRFMPKLFGCDVVYMPNQAPGAIHIDWDIDKMESFTAPDIDKNDVVKKMIADAEELKRKYGHCHGGINMGSPLNVAVALFGENFLTCCAEQPETATHVLMEIAKTQFALIEKVCRAIEPEAFPVRPMSYGSGNCPAIMLSPRMYRRVVLPVDKWMRGQCDYYGLHHCGVFDKYAELYTELKPDSLDVGGGSDYTLLRKYFPDTPASFIVNAEYIEGASTESIDYTVRNIVENGGPVNLISHLWCADLSRNTTDDNIYDLWRSIEKQGLASGS